MAQDCFGGETQVNEVDNDGWEMSTKQENIQNAYLLVYDRVKVKQSHTTEAEAEGEDGIDR